MAERLEAAEASEDEYTRDGTVDLHGNPVLRSKRGGWKACSFVVGTDARTDAHLVMLTSSASLRDFLAFFAYPSIRFSF
jgi:hypothetical protein